MKTEMKIGVDAKWYFGDLPSGRVWTRGITTRFKAAAADQDWTFFFRRGDRVHASNVPPCDQAVFASAGWNLLSNALVLPRHVASLGLDVLLTHYFAAPARVPQVTVVYDIIFESNPELFTRKERAYLSFIKPLLRSASVVVTISEQSRSQLTRFGYLGRGQECVVVPPGIDRQFLEPVPVTEISRVRDHYELPARFVLYVGRLNKRKNVGELIAAMAQIKDRSVQLVLAGRADGATEDYASLADQLGLADRVQFLDSVPDEDLASLYASSAVFAYLSEHEGFGLPPVEAMGVGVPVIVAETPVGREVYGDVPFYVAVSDIGEIARTLDDVLAEPRDIGPRLTRGQRRAGTYTWDRTTASLIDVLVAQGARSSRTSGAH
jgi:glycosyltransferase involved in cell wall biosynthesis